MTHGYVYYIAMQLNSRKYLINYNDIINTSCIYI